LAGTGIQTRAAPPHSARCRSLLCQSPNSSRPSSLPRGGDFDALIVVLEPDVVLRSDVGDGGRGTLVVRGASTAAK